MKKLTFIFTLVISGWSIDAQTRIAAGKYGFSLVACPNGSVQATGWNAYGQLGDGTEINKYSPVQVTGLTGVVAVDGGDTHSLALKNDGTVWAWGDNSNGELGDGTYTDHILPMQINSLSGITAIAASRWRSMALKNDGTVWSWGGSSNQSTPLQVNGLSGIIAIAAGVTHSLALKSDGTVWGWGANNFGQLGDGTTNTPTVPVQAVSLSGIVAIAAGQYHSLALKNDGTVWAWGYNSFGELGNGTTTNSAVPIQVNSLNGVTFIACGYWHSLAVKNDGTAWAWGDNQSGQIGDGTTTHRYLPTHVGSLTGVTAVSGGELHSMAVTTSGVIWGWGDNLFGELGIGSNFSAYSPVPMAGPSAVISVIGSSMVICPSQSKTLSANTAAGLTYQWRLNNVIIPGATQSTYVTSTGGNYTCIVANSCAGTISNTITLTNNVLPVMPGPITGFTEICHRRHNIRYSVDAVANTTSYTWTVPSDAVIRSGEGTELIKVTFGSTAGNITVTANNVCGSGPVRTLAITMPCREGEEFLTEDFDVALYPNPAADKLSVICYSLSGNETLTIYNAIGETILKFEIQNPKSEIDIHSLPDGMYFAQIISGEQKKIVKFIKQE